LRLGVLPSCQKSLPVASVYYRSRFQEVKRTKKIINRSKRFELGEYIRVVPLHHPKPAPPATAELTYRNGPLITNVEVYTVFWGNLWGSTSTSTDLMSKLNKFFADIVVSAAIDQLAEYGVPGQAIGHGSFVGTKVISANAPVGA
jgi:hypothetical protein